jgi:hypothetical protein
VTRLDPHLLFALLHAHLPPEVRDHVLVVGSPLAAAMSHREQLRERGVNTKDCDVIIHPAGALPAAAQLAASLFDAGWRPLPRCKPGPKGAPESLLEVIRLNPPESDAYFIELLGLPDAQQAQGKVMIPYEVNGGWYVLPSFRFMAVLSHEQRTHNGVAYAAPSMMALANLLAHRQLGTARVSEAMAGRNPLRSAKDLGRVLALARLELRETTEAWPALWLSALQRCFPDQWRELAQHAGDGLRALLADNGALNDAHHTVTLGLLDGAGVTIDQLQLVGQQFVLDVIEPLAEAAQRE